MSNTSEIITLVRQCISDFSKSGSDVFTYASSSIFTITESNVISISAIFINDVEIGASLYSFDSSTLKVTISSSMTAGDTVEVQYTYYPDYSDTEISNYIQSVLVHLSVENYYTYEIDSAGDLYPNVSEKEKNLIAFLASTLIEPNNESYSLPDLRVVKPRDLSTTELVHRAISRFKQQDTHGFFDLT